MELVGAGMEPVGAGMKPVSAGRLDDASTPLGSGSGPGAGRLEREGAGDPGLQLGSPTAIATPSLGAPILCIRTCSERHDPRYTLFVSWIAGYL